MNGKKEIKDNRKTLVRIEEAARITCCHPHTLRKYTNEGKIKCYTTPSGQRRFDKEELEAYINSFFAVKEVPQDKTRNFIYARVSSKKQMDDLERQIEYLQCYREQYRSYDVISDIGSGINFKRKGLNTILDACIQGTIGEIVVSHRDRLSRFGFELIELVVDKCGGKLIVLDDERNKTSDQELAEDLLSIIHIYSCKQMGKRSYKKAGTSKVVEDKDKTNDESEEDT